MKNANPCEHYRRRETICRCICFKDTLARFICTNRGAIRHRGRGQIPLSTPQTLLTDIAVLIGTLLKVDVEPQWERWLPPHTLQAVNERLVVKEVGLWDSKLIRSELQTGRLRWLHYLAQVSGLISIQAGVLKPNLQAWDWLQQDADAQWFHLWQAVETDLRQHERLWDVYRFPAISYHLWVMLNGREPSKRRIHEQLNSDIAEYLLLAVRVFQKLTGTVKPSVPIPAALSHWLCEQIDDADLSYQR